MSTNSVLVSIVTPSYNQADYIETTILSVINQDYPYIEYIVFDGGSTDGSIDIIKKYADKISFWKSEPDNGQSDAINKGWKMAKGEIFFYLNSDDYLHNSNVVSQIVEAYNKDPNAAIFYGDCIVVNEKGVQTSYKKAKNADTHTLLKERIMANVLFQTASFFNAIYVRELDYLNENLHYCMDYKLIVGLSLKGKMCRIDKPIANFRVHSHSKSHNGMIPMMKELIAIKWQYNKLYSLIYTFHYAKFRIFERLPIFIQKIVNPNLYQILNGM